MEKKESKTNIKDLAIDVYDEDEAYLMDRILEAFDDLDKKENINTHKKKEKQK